MESHSSRKRKLDWDDNVAAVTTQGIDTLIDPQLFQNDQTSDENISNAVEPELRDQHISKRQRKIAAVIGEVGGNDREKGLVQTTLAGNLMWRSAQDQEWRHAVYHDTIRGRLVAESAKRGKYVHGRPQGRGGQEDVTSFHPNHREWGSSRVNWPEILFTIERKDPIPDYEVKIWTDRNRVVLDGDNHPVKAFRDLPLTLSSETEGWEIEAIQRTDPRITSYDVRARMQSRRPTPTGESAKQCSANALNMRCSRFRARFGLLSWTKRKGTGNKNVFLKTLYPAECLRSNSSRGFPIVLTKEGIQQLEKPNKGGFDHLRGGRPSKDKTEDLEEKQRASMSLEGPSTEPLFKLEVISSTTDGPSPKASFRVEDDLPANHCLRTQYRRPTEHQHLAESHPVQDCRPSADSTARKRTRIELENDNPSERAAKRMRGSSPVLEQQRHTPRSTRVYHIANACLPQYSDIPGESAVWEFFSPQELNATERTDLGGNIAPRQCRASHNSDSPRPARASLEETSSAEHVTSVQPESNFRTATSFDDSRYMRTRAGGEVDLGTIQRGIASPYVPYPPPKHPSATVLAVDSSNRPVAGSRHRNTVGIHSVDAATIQPWDFSPYVPETPSAHPLVSIPAMATAVDSNSIHSEQSTEPTISFLPRPSNLGLQIDPTTGNGIKPRFDNGQQLETVSDTEDDPLFDMFIDMNKGVTDDS